MGKILVIAEKPSVGRDIAKTLGVAQKADGFLFSDTHIVSWAIGHLVELCEPEDYDGAYKKWSAAALPIVPAEIKLKPVANTRKQFNVLKGLMNSKDVDYIVCATDSGREGELIFRYIYALAKCRKPFKRLWISSMTDTAIREGFANIKDGSEYDALYRSARCRSEADWLVGINATRAYTVKYKALLSVGRVQTPTLAIITGRQEEINAFVPRDYWEINGAFDGYTGVWINNEQENDTKIFEHGKAVETANRVEGKTGCIASVSTEEKRVPPPLLYDLTELQRDCNRRYGYPAQKTLSVAQDLYEKRKLITYPRTDSRYLSSDMPSKIADTLKKLDATEFGEYTGYILNLPKLPLSKRIIDDAKISDHHAIIPTDVTPKLNALSADELNVYRLVALRFLAAFYPAYIYSVTRIISNVENELFLTKGNTVTQLGWMKLYKDIGDKTADSSAQELPAVAEGEAARLNEAVIEKKKTQPPKPYTEATLLSAMENAGRFVEDEELKEKLKESGLGTPATRAAIIERLLQVGYVVRKAKALAPTEKGMKLVQVVPRELSSPETTGKWEKGLTSIAKGKLDAGRFMESIVRYVSFIVTSSAGSDTGIVFPEDKKGKTARRGAAGAKAICKCPECGEGGILENSKGYYCTRWRDGCKFTIWKSALEKEGTPPSDTLVAELCGRLAAKKGERNA